MPQSIVSIGVQVPGGEIEYVRHTEKISLLDWDIIILSTYMHNSFYYGSDTYNGKPCLSDDSSFRYTESLNHWKNEIRDAFKNGKSIIILLDDYEEIFIATGTKSYSGTGRNQKTTRHVTPIDNYSFLPFPIDIRTSIGKQMVLNPKFQYLKELFTSFSGEFSYKVTLESDDLLSLVSTKTGNKTVGGIFIHKESNGYILLLPLIDFENESFIVTRNDNEYWSKSGKEFGEKFITSIVNIDKTIRGSSNKTPQPTWVSSDEFLLPKEVSIRKGMISKESKIVKLQAEIQKAKDKLIQETSLKDLLFEQGKPLEHAILKALKLIGFNVSQYKENDSEFDIVFECSEGRFLGEAEGKDTKPINIEKLRQLEMNINEDFSRDEVETIAKGVLFGNACRLLPIKERKEFFTNKCIIAANRSEVALIKTHDLFFICQNIENLSDIDIKEIRNKILTTTGIVDFEEYFKSTNVEQVDDET